MNDTALLRRLCFTCGSRLDAVHLLGIETWTPVAAKPRSTTETDAVYFHHAVPIEVEQSHNGRDLSRHAHAAQLKQALRLQKLIDSAAPADSPLLNLAGEIWTMPRLESLYVWQAEPAQPIAGIACVALRFTPKPGLRPGSRLERILSRTAGVLMIDPATGQVLSGSFYSLGSVGFGGGLLAHFSDFSGEFSMQPIPGSLAWVLRRVEVRVQGRELFHRIHGTETITYTIQ